jgi:hypothetical protein
MLTLVYGLWFLILFIYCLMQFFLIFVYNVNLCVTVIDKYSSNLILVISNVSRLKLHNVCDFHSQGVYLNGMFGNKIK